MCLVANDIKMLCVKFDYNRLTTIQGIEDTTAGYLWTQM